MGEDSKEIAKEDKKRKPKPWEKKEKIFDPADVDGVLQESLILL